MKGGWRLRLLAWSLRLCGVRSRTRVESCGSYLVAARFPLPVTVSVRVEGDAVLWMTGVEDVVVGRRLLPAAAVVAWLCSGEGMWAVLEGGGRG